MKKMKLIKREDGFTLIEIIAVLVIMGILAAVAIPKFFDLQQRAREKALYTAVSELKVRVNQWFASQLLDGKTVGAITYDSGSVDINIGDDFAISSWDSSSDADNILFTIKYFPAFPDTTKNVLTKTLQELPKPKTGT